MQSHSLCAALPPASCVLLSTLFPSASSAPGPGSPGVIALHCALCPVGLKQGAFRRGLSHDDESDQKALDKLTLENC